MLQNKKHDDSNLWNLMFIWRLLVCFIKLIIETWKNTTHCRSRLNGIYLCSKNKFKLNSSLGDGGGNSWCYRELSVRLSLNKTVRAFDWRTAVISKYLLLFYVSTDS